jgi:histone-lysine N-methyltransferase SETMAR
VEDERPGRPVTMKTDENVDKVRTLIRNDRRLSIRMIAEEFNVDKETVRQILTENLKMTKVCAKMVPKNMSKDQKLNREKMCQNVLEKTEEDPVFLNSVITCNETWLFNTTQKPNDNQYSGKQLTFKDQKGTNVKIQDQENACRFLQDSRNYYD